MNKTLTPEANYCAEHRKDGITSSTVSSIPRTSFCTLSGIQCFISAYFKHFPPKSMEAHSIVVSLEWAKKLKEAGWVGSEHFLWAYHCWDFPAGSEFQKPFLTCKELEDHYHQWEMYAAPTAEEILRRLPDTIYRDSILIVQHFLDEWHVQYLRGNTPSCVESDASLANAAAALACYLVEQGLLSFKNA